MLQLQSMTNVVWCGDDEFDSMGYTAKFDTQRFAPPSNTMDNCIESQVMLQLLKYISLSKYGMPINYHIHF